MQIHRRCRIHVTAIGLWTIAAVAGAQTPITAEQRALHALNRLTFGPRPGEVQRVASIGVERWIEQQLRPETIDDKGARLALVGCPVWTDSISSIVNQLAGPDMVTSMGPPSNINGSGMVRSFSIAILGTVAIRSDSIERTGNLAPAYRRAAQMLSGRLARAEGSDQQLLEVMTDFWENHFSIWSQKTRDRGALVEFDRVVIRPNALGKFRQLLGAVAKSPAMLWYLDNVTSVADTSRRKLSPNSPLPAPRPSEARTGLNENYARELLELHTLGVDGGYTQHDVTDVARILTGWTSTTGGSITLPRAGSFGYAEIFIFDPSRHDAEAKTVLGVSFPEGRGQEEGELLLDLLARHPSTARFIARKLAVRFVSDDPPPALVERAAQTFLNTDGDIREVMRTILTSPEFFSPEAIGAKVKSPVELVLGTRRILGAPVDTVAQEIDLLIDLGQAPFGKQTPDGWPERGEAWLGFSGINARLTLAKRIAAGEIRTIPPEAWPSWKPLVTAQFDAQMNGVISGVLNGRVSEGTRAAMAALRPRTPDAATSREREASLRELLAMALASPDFQHR